MCSFTNIYNERVQMDINYIIEHCGKRSYQSLPQSLISVCTKSTIEAIQDNHPMALHKPKRTRSDKSEPVSKFFFHIVPKRCLEDKKERRGLPSFNPQISQTRPDICNSSLSTEQEPQNAVASWGARPFPCPPAKVPKTAT